MKRKGVRGRGRAEKHTTRYSCNLDRLGAGTGLATGAYGEA